jgi:hypothetical protein
MGLAGQHPTVVLPAGAAADDFAFQPPLDPDQIALRALA